MCDATNLYGPGGNYDRATSHVLPAMMQIPRGQGPRRQDRDTLGKRRAATRVPLQRRHGDPCLHLLELPDDRLASLVHDRVPPLVNVGSDEDLTIRELAKRVRSSQSRVAKMEAGDVSISLDLFMKTLFAAGAENRDLARAVTPPRRILAKSA